MGSYDLRAFFAVAVCVGGCAVELDDESPQPEQTEVGSLSSALVGDVTTTVSVNDHSCITDSVARTVRCRTRTSIRLPGSGGAAADPNTYGMCGVRRIAGSFDQRSAARVIVDAQGFYVAEVIQSFEARAIAPATFDATCVRLTSFDGVPVPSLASALRRRVVDTADALRSESVRSNADVSGTKACVWAGFDGPLNYPAGADFLDVGAYERSSRSCRQGFLTGTSACGRAPGGLRAPYRNMLVANAPHGTLGADTFCTGWNTHIWSFAPEANQNVHYDLFDVSGTTSTRTSSDDHWCYISGLSRGTNGSNFAPDPLVDVELVRGSLNPMEPLVYFVRSRTAGTRKTGVWVECIPRAQ